MRITSIELAGSSKATLRDGTPGLPQGFARLTRKAGEEHITVELLTSSGEHTHQVQGDDRDDQWSMAENLQHAFDGYRGTNCDINDYFRAIQLLGD
jgi:hypothetical protein